jgi:hypothetical protein
MSESLHVNRLRAADYVADEWVKSMLGKEGSKRILSQLNKHQGDQDGADYLAAANNLRQVLHRFLSKEPPRVGVGVDVACTLLELDQKTVQKYKDQLGYDKKLPLTQRYDYHDVRRFGVRGHVSKKGKLVYALQSGGVIVGTFLGTNDELEKALAGGATLSLMSLPAALARPWKSKDERDFWQDAMLGALERASQVERAS